MTKTCGECNWYERSDVLTDTDGLCRAHTYLKGARVSYGIVPSTLISCHKFREGEKKNQLVNDNWERGGSWHAHSQDH